MIEPSARWRRRHGSKVTRQCRVCLRHSTKIYPTRFVILCKVYATPDRGSAPDDRHDVRRGERCWRSRARSPIASRTRRAWLAVRADRRVGGLDLICVATPPSPGVSVPSRFQALCYGISAAFGGLVPRMRWWLCAGSMAARILCSGRLTSGGHREECTPVRDRDGVCAEPGGRDGSLRYRRFRTNGSRHPGLRTDCDGTSGRTLRPGSASNERARLVTACRSALRGGAASRDRSVLRHIFAAVRTATVSGRDRVCVRQNGSPAARGPRAAGAASLHRNLPGRGRRLRAGRFRAGAVGVEVGR